MPHFPKLLTDVIILFTGSEVSVSISVNNLDRRGVLAQRALERNIGSVMVHLLELRHGRLSVR